jgi:hypothetical protein
MLTNFVTLANTYSLAPMMGRNMSPPWLVRQKKKNENKKILLRVRLVRCLFTKIKIGGKNSAQTLIKIKKKKNQKQKIRQ